MADPKTGGAPWCCRCWNWKGGKPSPYPEDDGKAWDCSRICDLCLARYDAEVEETRAWLAAEAMFQAWTEQAAVLAGASDA